MTPFLPPMPLAFVSLAAPLMLAGGLLVSLPIAAHLMSRRPSLRVYFPSLELMDACRAGQSALHRFRRWILLALRLLAVAALVLAFARPLWFGGQQAQAGDPSRGVAVVLVLDASLSTTQPLASGSAFSNLQSRAHRVLDALTPGRDAAGLVVADATARTPLPGLSANPAAIAAEVDRAHAGFARADLAAAIARAGTLLSSGRGERPGRVVVLTDLQASQLDAAALAAAAKALPPGTAVDVESPEFAAAGLFPGNNALESLRVEPAVPAAGETARVVVRATRHGEGPREAAVFLEVEGVAAPLQATLLLPAHGSAEAAFNVPFPRAGWRKLKARLADDGADALGADNAAFAAVRVADRREVVLVADAGPGTPGSDCWFLARALAPSAGSGDPFAVRHLTPSEVTPAALERADCVCVLAGGPWSSTATAGLARFLRKGGHAVFFGGPGALPANLAALAKALGEPVSPCPVGAFIHWDADGSWRRLGAVGNAQAAGGPLAAFDPPSRDALRKIAFRRAWALDEPLPGAQVFLRWETGAPAAATLPLACGGRVSLCAFGAALADGDLPKHGAMVALAQELAVLRTGGEAAIGPARCGMPAIFPSLAPLASGGGAPQVVGPDGKGVAEASFDLLGDLPVATAAAPEVPGIYTAVQDVGGRQVPLGLLAVNVDPREGDLRRAGIPALGTDAGGAKTPARADAAQAVRDAGGIPVWGWLAALALLFLGLEMLVAGGIRK